MTPEEQTADDIVKRTRFWWATPWRWPSAVRHQQEKITALTGSVEHEQKAVEEAVKLAALARESAEKATNSLCAERGAVNTLSEELGNAKVQLQKASETIAGLEGRITRGELETERIKAELSKTQADLARNQFEQAREKDEHTQTRTIVRLLREWIHTTHRVDIPARSGTIKNILAGMKRLLIVALPFLPLCANAQFPPPILRGPFTTNTVAWAQTNVVSLSTTNATSKPLTNHYQDGVLTLFGLEAGANVTLTVNGSNIVITGSAGGGGGLTTNENQFLGVPLSIKSGAVETNVTFWQSNALLPALIATNQPGGTVDLFTFLTTNGAGIKGTSNGAVVVRGVIGSTTNYFEVRNSNNITPIFAVTHSNTVRIVTPNSGAAEAGGIIFDCVQGFTQTPVHFFVGGAQSGTWRADSGGDQNISANGKIVFNNDGSGSGQVNFNVSGVGVMWSHIPSASVAAWHGGTSRRGQITNVWDIWGRTNMWLTRTGLFDGIVLTNDIRFLGHNSTSNDVWVCTNTVTGEGEWRAYGMAQLSDVADTVNSGFNGDLLSFHSGMELWTNSTPNQSQFLVSTLPLTIRDGATVTNLNNIGVLHITNKPGVDRAVRFWNTNGLGYSEWGVVTQAWLPTNKFLLSITNPVAGEVLEIQSVSYADGVASIVITNAPDNSGGGGGLTTNANQFGASVELTIKGGAFLTNMNYFGTGTNNGDFYSQNHFPLADNTYNLGSATLAWLGAYVREDGVNFMEVGGGADAVLISAPASIASAYTLILPNAQGADGQVITNNGSGTLGWWTPGGPVGFNQNQFASNGNLVSIKSGVLLTNTLFYPSNLTGPATIHFSTTDQVTNTTEWRSTNDSINLMISSNANAIVYGRLDMSNRVAFRTNNIDFRMPVYQAFTNALQTNLVLQLTNVYEGVTHRIDAYGAGRLGNGRTNAWQILCTVAANHFIYWPPGTTNGNFDVLVNSNQIVSFTFMGGLGSTNILAAYRVLEGIGAN